MKIRTVGRSNIYKQAITIDKAWGKKWLALRNKLDKAKISAAKYDDESKKLRVEYGTTDLELKTKYLAEKVSSVENPKWIYGSEAEINISPRTGEPDGKIYWMSPDEYLKLAGLDMRRVRLDAVEYHIGRFRSGEGVYVGHLKVENDAVINQEGRHRALAAKKCGIAKMPVLVYGKGFEHFTPSRTKPNFESVLAKTI